MLNKDNTNISDLQGNFEIYENLADMESVSKEIGDIIAVINLIIREAIDEVEQRRKEDTNKYRVNSQFYSQDLNATIKKKIVDKMHDFNFMNHVKFKINKGSYFFIIKNRYVLYIKRLYTKQNKPAFNPKTFKNLASGGLFPELKQIPLLFMGPNIKPTNEVEVFVTSMVSKKEVNWSIPSYELFEQKGIIIPITTKITEEEAFSDDEVLRIKEERKVKKSKKGNN